MANIKKSFNFRNGVQVDDDNLKVSATGLVGIGTTVPTEALDVRGNLIVSGVSSAVTAQAGVMTVTTLNPTEIIGAGVSIVSGIVTASSGIITFFGDARFLQGMPTSQWEDVNTGLGVTSIYNTGGNVGIATSNPQFTLQIGSNVNLSQNGVGISSAGDIKISGVATATGFVGALTGDVTGDVTGNVTGNLTGNIASNTIISGNVDLNGDIDVDGHTNLDNVSVSGVTTFTDTTNSGTSTTGAVIIAGGLGVSKRVNLDSDLTVNGGILYVQGAGSQIFVDAGSKIMCNGDLDVNKHTNLDNVSVAGVTTFSGRIEGAATNNVIPFLYSDLASLPSAGSYHGAFAHVHATGRGYFAHAGNWWELVNKESDGRIGTGAELYNIGSINAAGIITATTNVTTFRMGVGTNQPSNDIQVRKTNDTEIQVTSDTGTAGITVGRESGTNNTNNAEFRYGKVSSGAPYSSAQSLDLLNYGTGNFNYHLSANNAGAVAGDFHWHKGVNNTRLMTLTGIGGSLGIGITTPSDELHVIGGATISGNVNVGNNLTVSGTVIGNLQGQLTGNVTGTLAGNSNATVGISTLNNLTIAGVATVSTKLDANILEIGATNTQFPFTVNNSDDRTFISGTGGVGIKTTSSLANVTINASQANASIAAVAIGATVLKSAVDFADAGTVTTRFMLPPKVTPTERDSLSGVVAGAMIYNNVDNRVEVYNGSSWKQLDMSNI